MSRIETKFFEFSLFVLLGYLISFFYTDIDNNNLITGNIVFGSVDSPVGESGGQAQTTEQNNGYSGFETGTTRNIVNGVKVVANENGEKWSYIHSDRLLNNRLVTSETGEKISEFKALPYGQTVIKSTNRLEFTGKEKDENGVYYFDARYYDPDLGKFSSVDPIIDNHAFSYVNNNPLKYVDPTGMDLDDPALVETFSKLRSTINNGPGMRKLLRENNAARILSRWGIQDENFRMPGGLPGRLAPIVNLPNEVLIEMAVASKRNDISVNLLASAMVAQDFVYNSENEIKNPKTLNPNSFDVNIDLQTLSDNLHGMSNALTISENQFLIDATERGFNPTTIDSTLRNAWSVYYYLDSKGAQSMLTDLELNEGSLEDIFTPLTLAETSDSLMVGGGYLPAGPRSIEKNQLGLFASQVAGSTTESMSQIGLLNDLDKPPIKKQNIDP